MLVERKNPFTGEMISREIPVKAEDLKAWESGQGLIQNLMPYLSADDREFLMTGITPEQWEEMFKED